MMWRNPTSDDVFVRSKARLLFIVLWGVAAIALVLLYVALGGGR